MINNEIEESYCSTEVSRLLKEKGFACLCRYYEYKGKREITYYKNDPMLPERIYIPTHSVAREWLRVNFGIWIDASFDAWNKETYSYSVCIKGKPDYHYDNFEAFETPYEAVEAALLYVLQNEI